MAAIDKTYVSSWKDYKEIRDWASKTDLIYPNGINGGKMINWFYFPNLTEDDFNNHKEYVLWNTCYSVDIFLYKNCPFKLVQDRLIEQYGDTSELDKESIDLHEVGNHFTINEQLIILDTYYIVEVIYNGSFWYYSYRYDRWVSPYEYGSFCGSCTLKITSKKALARKIRKWNLPKGTIIKFTSIRYINDFVVTIRK